MRLAEIEQAIRAAVAARDVPAAVQLLERLLILQPQDWEARLFLAGLYRESGRLRDAVLACDSIIAATPGHGGAWLEKAQTLAAGGSLDAAHSCFAEAARLWPANAVTWAGLAGIDAVRGRGEDAREAALRAIRLDPASLPAASALAQSALETGDIEHALPILADALTRTSGPDSARVTALSLMGDLKDRLNDTKGAFAAYKESKSLLRILYRMRFGDRMPAQRALIQRTEASFRETDVDAWPIPSKQVASQGSFSGHCFLLGYPRSGTTLTQTVLAAIPGVATLEERPTLEACDGDLLLADDAMKRLRALDRQAAQPLREAYWHHVAQAKVGGGHYFVDMDPLKGIRLPIIARLFPQADILVMRRDPRAVIWSCFHTNFAMTSAAWDFADLTDCCLHFDALMGLTTLCLERLPLRAHVVRLEDLVTDFEQESRAMCAALALPWSEDLHRFDRTERARKIGTASAGQVRKGLFDSRDQWRRYERHLEPVMHLLEPWIEKFGYA